MYYYYKNCKTGIPPQLPASLVEVKTLIFCQYKLRTDIKQNKCLMCAPKTSADTLNLAIPCVLPSAK